MKKLLIGGSVVSVLAVFAAIFAILFDSENGNDGDDCSGDYSEYHAGKITGTGGDWTKKGTASYKTAKAIFDFLTKEMGFSGAGGAGAVAVAIRESTLNPKAMNTGGKVAGLFQWSMDGSPNAGSGGKGRLSLGGIIKSSKDLTVDKELKLTKYELNHGYSVVKSAVGKATNPQKAAEQWSLKYEGVSLSDGQTKVDQIHSDAVRAYKLFSGSKVKAKSSLLGKAQKGASSASDSASMDDGCDDGDLGPAPKKGIVNNAKQLMGYFSYEQSHGVSFIGSVKHPKKNGVTDCSGFVWLVLARAGCKVPPNMAWYTMTMAQDARGPHKYLKKISAKQTSAGDIVIANQGAGSGNDGHTAILAEKWHGANTKIYQMGGGGAHANRGTFAASFGYLANSDICFARAIKK